MEHEKDLQRITLGKEDPRGRHLLFLKDSLGLSVYGLAMEKDDVVKEKSLKESHCIHQDFYDIRSQTLGENHPYTLLTLSYLARVKLSQDWRFSVYDAIEILEHCLSTHLRLHDPKHEWALFTMVQLALAYRIREERGTQTHERLSLQLRMHLFEVYVHEK